MCAAVGSLGLPAALRQYAASCSVHVSARLSSSEVWKYVHRRAATAETLRPCGAAGTQTQPSRVEGNHSNQFVCEQALRGRERLRLLLHLLLLFCSNLCPRCSCFIHNGPLFSRVHDSEWESSPLTMITQHQIVNRRSETPFVRRCRCFSSTVPAASA